MVLTSYHVMKRMSQRDLARMLGVNASTISRALKGENGVSADLRQKILQLAEEHGYRPNPFAMSLRYDTTRTIGVIVPDLAFSHFAHIVKHIEAEARKAGYMCIKPIISTKIIFALRISGASRLAVSLIFLIFFHPDFFKGFITEGILSSSMNRIWHTLFKSTIRSASCSLPMGPCIGGLIILLLPIMLTEPF